MIMLLVKSRNLIIISIRTIPDINTYFVDFRHCYHFSSQDWDKFVQDYFLNELSIGGFS